MKLTAIPAKVVNVDRLGDEYFVAVKVESEKYQGTFESLSFGEPLRNLSLRLARTCLSSESELESRAVVPVVDSVRRSAFTVRRSAADERLNPTSRRIVEELHEILCRRAIH